MRTSGPKQAPGRFGRPFHSDRHTRSRLDRITANGGVPAAPICPPKKRAASGVDVEAIPDIDDRLPEIDERLPEIPDQLDILAEITGGTSGALSWAMDSAPTSDAAQR